MDNMWLQLLSKSRLLIIFYARHTKAQRLALNHVEYQTFYLQYLQRSLLWNVFVTGWLNEITKLCAAPVGGHDWPTKSISNLEKSKVLLPSTLPMLCLSGVEALPVD